MHLRLNNRGFTLVQVMVVGTIMVTILLASTQATLYFIRSMIAIEKSSDTISESQELLGQIRRSSQNLTMSRINGQSTFYRANSAQLQALNPNTPVASMNIPAAQLINQGGSHPLVGRVRTAAPGVNYPYYLDSFDLEEHAVESTGTGINKKTRRILVARCGPFSDYVNLTQLTGSPAITALYVIAALKMRPFLTYTNDGQPKVNCCPIDQPNCTSSLYSHFFRGYSIALDRNQSIVSIEEFPKSVPGAAVVGAGFGIYFNKQNSNTMQLVTFSIASRCKSLTLSQPPQVCNQGNISLPDFMRGAQGISNLLKLDTRSLTISIANDIGSTGIISL